MTRYIDADALIAKFKDDLENLQEFAFQLATIGAINTVKHQPTVDAVPVRHGKWEVTPVYIKCSECGESFMLIPQNYCPNCGARMDEK